MSESIFTNLTQASESVLIVIDSLNDLVQAVLKIPLEQLREEVLI
jgi:hypothetical protein